VAGSGDLNTIAFYITIVEPGAGRAVILNLTYPIFGTIIAALWLKEKVPRAALFWMMFGLAGLIVFLSNDAQPLKPSGHDLLALAGALGSGWVVVIIRRLRHMRHSRRWKSPAACSPSSPPGGWSAHVDQEPVGGRDLRDARRAR
jgi:drug/metabolite transporter (DMT)-like permease